MQYNTAYLEQCCGSLEPAQLRLDPHRDADRSPAELAQPAQHRLEIEDARERLLPLELDDRARRVLERIFAQHTPTVGIDQRGHLGVRDHARADSRQVRARLWRIVDPAWRAL